MNSTLTNLFLAKLKKLEPPKPVSVKTLGNKCGNSSLLFDHNQHNYGEKTVTAKGENTEWCLCFLPRTLSVLRALRTADLMVMKIYLPLSFSPSFPPSLSSSLPLPLKAIREESFIHTESKNR